LLVIPVLDVKGGVVVHAKMGLRSSYKPLTSPVYSTCNPSELGLKLLRDGFKVVYVADLDSIMGGSPSIDVLSSLRRLGLSIVADLGVDSDYKLELAIKHADCVVVATESTPSLEFLSQSLSAIGVERAMLSLDVKGGLVVSRCRELSNASLEEAASKAEELGFRSVLLIDFDRIGSYSGPNLDGIKLLLKRGFEVYCGGGVRDIADLEVLRSLGVRGVLVASALYFGRISVKELREKSFLQ